MQLSCHIQREFQVHERMFDMMDGARGHLEIGAVVVEVVDGSADEHADADAVAVVGEGRGGRRLGAVVRGLNAYRGRLGRRRTVARSLGAVILSQGKIVKLVFSRGFSGGCYVTGWRKYSLR